jgi:hypothetical protein
MDVLPKTMSRGFRTAGLPLSLLLLPLLAAMAAAQTTDPPPSGGGTGGVRVGDTLFVAAATAGGTAPAGAVVDAEPPSIRFQVTGPEVFEDRGEPRKRSRKDPWSVPRKEGQGPSLAWSVDGRKWLPLRWGEGPLEEGGAWASDQVASEAPQLFFAAPRTKLLNGNEEVRIGDGQMLWVVAEDTGAGVARLAFRTRPAAPPTGVNLQNAAADGPPPGSVLEIEAVDLVGNTSRLEWALAPRSR